MRLTQTSWVFNWLKRLPVFVNLEEQHEVLNWQGGVVMRHTTNNTKSRINSISLRWCAEKRGTVIDNLDVRNERNKDGSQNE